MNAHSTPSTSAVSDKLPGATFLRRTLWANAAFSVLSGGAFAVFGHRLATWAGVPDGGLILRLVGVGVVLFGFALVALARREPLPSSLVRAVFLADLAWVAGSAYLVFADPFGLTDPGRLAVGAVSDVVLAFAILEGIGMRRLARDGA
jgi:hypothetical protein